MRLNLPKYYSKWFTPVFLFLLLCVIMKYRYNIPKTINPFISRNKEPVIPILVMACNDRFLIQSMNGLRLLRPNTEVFPIIVAQFCFNIYTTMYVQNLSRLDSSITYLEIPEGTVGHYKYALNYVFSTLEYKAVIVLEDDLSISPDFYEYFLGTYPLLKNDSSIWCVSAWNDNCKKGLVEENKPSLLHRTDYFPKNGWMILSGTWKEIEPRLVVDVYNSRIPTGGRVCIRPEISRTCRLRSDDEPSQDEEQRLINTQFVQFTKQDFSYLSKEYEQLFVNFVYSCPETTVYDIKKGNVNSSSKFLRITCSDTKSFRRAAKTLGLMYDLSHGVPRTAFHGIVQCYINERRIYLARNLFQPVTYNNTSSNEMYDEATEYN